VPDGLTRIFFQSGHPDLSNRPQIHVMAGDGAGQRRLIASNNADIGPDASHDGQRIVSAGTSGSTS
jgi:hypothetical protein